MSTVEQYVKDKRAIADLIHRMEIGERFSPESLASKTGVKAEEVETILWTLDTVAQRGGRYVRVERERGVPLDVDPGREFLRDMYQNCPKGREPSSDPDEEPRW